MSVKSTKYDGASLAPVVQQARSISDVLRTLGLPTTGGNHRMITARIRLAGLDTSHFGRATLAARCAAVAPDTLAVLVARSTSVAQVLQELGLPPEGRAHREMSRRLRALGLVTTHFRGRGWSRGETKATHASVERVAKAQTWTDDQVFVDNSPFLDGRAIARRLVALGWRYSCAWCGISEWRGAHLVLHLDHINGIHNDNRLANLRFLCPNCHSQTDTFGNRRR